MSRSAEELSDAWRDVISSFRAKGYEMKLTSVIAPVQIEGRLPDGQPFYFRERGGFCSLGIGDDPVQKPRLVATRTLSSPGLLPEEGERLLTQMFDEVTGSAQPT